MEGILTCATPIASQTRSAPSASRPTYTSFSSSSQAGPSRMKIPAASQISARKRSSISQRDPVTGKKRHLIDLSLSSDEDVPKVTSSNKRAAIVSTSAPRGGSVTVKSRRDSISMEDFFEPKIRYNSGRKETKPKNKQASSSTRTDTGPSCIQRTSNPSQIMPTSITPSSRLLSGGSALPRTTSSQPRKPRLSDAISVASTSSSHDSSVVFTQSKPRNRSAGFGSHHPSPVRSQEIKLPPLSQVPAKPKKGGFGAHARRDVTPGFSIGEKRKFGRTPSKEDMSSPAKRIGEMDMLGGHSMRRSLSWKGKGKEGVYGGTGEIPSLRKQVEPVKRSAIASASAASAASAASSFFSQLCEMSGPLPLPDIVTGLVPQSTPKPISSSRRLGPEVTTTPCSSNSRSEVSRSIPTKSSSSGWTHSGDFTSFFSPVKSRHPESVSSGKTSGSSHSNSHTAPKAKATASISTILVPDSPPIKAKSTKKSYIDPISAKTSIPSPTRHLDIPTPKAKLPSATQRPSSKPSHPLKERLAPSSSQVPKPLRPPSATQSTKRKRSDPADKSFAPPSSSQAPSKTTTGKRKGSDRAARVDYTIPAIDAPDEAWVNRSTQLPSSTQRVTRARSRALSSASAGQPPVPPKCTMKQVEKPEILDELDRSRLKVSTGSSLSSLSPAPTPQKSLVSAAVKTGGSTGPVGPVLSPSKKQQEAPEEEEEEEEEDLLAEFAEYQFAPRSPTVSTGRLSQAPATPSRQRFSQSDLAAERKNNLLLTPTRAAFLQQSPSKPKSTDVSALATDEAREEQVQSVYDIEAENKKKEEIHAAAKAQAEAERAERWARWEKDKVENEEEEEDEEEEEPLLDALKALPAKDLRRSHRHASPSSQSPTPARASIMPASISRKDLRINNYFERLVKDHERDTSFERAYRSTTSQSPEKPSPAKDAVEIPFSYPTPTSRDPSGEPRELNEAAINDLDEELRGGAAQILKEAKAAEEAVALAEARAEKPWIGVWTGNARKPDTTMEVQSLTLEGLSQGLQGGLMGYAMKWAFQGETNALFSLLSGGFAARLDKNSTVALADFLLQTWLRTGDNNFMDSLICLVEHAKYQPFDECFAGIACTLFSDLGMDESVLPGFEPVYQAAPPNERNDTIGYFLTLLKQLARGAWLINSNAVDLAPVVCLICADPTTSAGVRDTGYALLKEFWPMCLAEMTAVGLVQVIAEYTECLPMAAKRDMLRSIGIDSEEGREITRWLAAELLDSGSLSSLAVDQIHLQPDIPTIKKGLYNIMDRLDEPKPDHVVIEYQIGFLYGMLDINGLAEELPLPAEGEYHPLHAIEKLVKRAEAMIKRSPCASATEIRNKIQLSQLAIIIKLKGETAVKRRRRLEREKVVEKLRAKGLADGVKGQLKLDFKSGAVAA